MTASTETHDRRPAEPRNFSRDLAVFARFASHKSTISTVSIRLGIGPLGIPAGRRAQAVAVWGAVTDAPAGLRFLAARRRVLFFDVA
jgi:hypothetical protein